MRRRYLWFAPPHPLTYGAGAYSLPLSNIQGTMDVIGQVWRVIGTAPRDGTRVDLWCLFTSWGVELKSYAFRVIDCWFDGYWRRYDEALGNDAPVENVYTEGGSIRACLWAAVPDVPDFLDISNDDDDEAASGGKTA